MSYNYNPDQYYSAIELLLYVLSFVTMILIFLYIAYERPAQKKKAAEEED